MSLEWEQVVVDAKDPHALGHWWATVLDWEVVDSEDEAVEIRPAPHTLPGLLFLGVDEPTPGKNRLHIDLRPDDQAVEVERLLALGARRADIGQGVVSWVVLTDPEGNEFCVLSAQRPVDREPGR
jgi:predicted enzyme related to lactoylglutathione lyase